MYYRYFKGLFFEYLSIFVLICKGYWILGRRIKTKCGEIDILALRNNCIHIIEVKYRYKEIDAYEALNNRTKKRVMRAFEYWISRNFQYSRYQFKLEYFVWFHYSYVHKIWW